MKVRIKEDACSVLFLSGGKYTEALCGKTFEAYHDKLDDTYQVKASVGWWFDASDVEVIEE